MDRRFGESRFWSTYIEDRKDGFSGLRLHRDNSGKTTVAAECIFWDACGQFFFRTFDGDVPVDIALELIAETRETIKVR